jgi:hypothetical protein
VVDKPGRAGRPAGLSLEPRRAHARGRRGSGAPARCRAGADEFRVEGRVASANPRLGLPSACAAGPGRCALAKAHIATAETLSGEQRAQAPRGIRGGPRGAAMEPQSSASPLPDGHPEPRRRCPLSRGSSARPFGENPARQLSGPLSWEFGARGRIRTDDLPITSRMRYHYATRAGGAAEQGRREGGVYRRVSGRARVVGVRGWAGGWGGGGGRR